MTAIRARPDIPPADNMEKFAIRELQPGDNLAGFSLGDAQYTPLKIFLQKHAQKYQEQQLARTYVYIQDKRICAYVALACTEIETNSLRTVVDIDDTHFPYNCFPAVRITRLAVDRRFRGIDIGKQLVSYAIELSHDMASIAGCRFVVLDAKKPAIGFYEKCGFRLVDSQENREKEAPVMLLDLKKSPR